MAIAGIVVSSVSIILIPLLIALLIPSLSRVRGQAKTIVAMNNAKQLCLAMVMYCDENDGRFPPSDSWPTALRPYLGGSETLLTSPFDPDAGRAFAMNAQLDGRERPEIRHPERTVLVFECRFGSPPGGGQELLPEQPRGPRGYVVGFLDGHVKSVRPGELDELIWIPGTQGFKVLR